MNSTKCATMRRGSKFPEIVSRVTGGTSLVWAKSGGIAAFGHIANQAEMAEICAARDGFAGL